MVCCARAEGTAAKMATAAEMSATLDWLVTIDSGLWRARLRALSERRTRDPGIDTPLRRLDGFRGSIPRDARPAGPGLVRHVARERGVVPEHHVLHDRFPRSHRVEEVLQVQVRAVEAGGPKADHVLRRRCHA